MNERRVLMLFGQNVVDLFDFMAPALAPSLARPPCRVVAVRMTGTPGKYRTAVPTGSGLGDAGFVPKISHYVIGVASAPDPSVAVAPADLGPPPSCATLAALRAGWVLKHTVAQGDCGIDVRAHFQGLGRNERHSMPGRRLLACCS